MSIKNKKEQQERLKSEVLKIESQLRCHLGDPIRDIKVRNTIVRKPIGM